MMAPLDIAVFGLSVTSSWGNGHATTFRALLGGLRANGHRVLFLERDMPWYAGNRDLPDPGFCELVLYDDPVLAIERHAERLRRADAVIVGSFVPDGVGVIDRLASLGLRALLFYDIDTPVTLAGLEQGREDYLARRQIPLFDAYLSFAGGPVLQRLETNYGARRALPLYCSVDPQSYPFDPGITKRWDLGYLGTYSDDRQPTLERLLLEPARRLPQMRFVVAGPQYPSGIDWPENVERMEHLPPDRHGGFYNAQRFTLNVTRSAMRAMGWSPSVRLFEAAACGTPVISDRWDGLSDLLPDGEAIVIADDTEAVVATLTAMAEEQRAAMGAAARRLVLDGHTGEARARELVAAISELQRGRN